MAFTSSVPALAQESGDVFTVQVGDSIVYDSRDDGSQVRLAQLTQSVPPISSFPRTGIPSGMGATGNARFGQLGGRTPSSQSPFAGLSNNPVASNRANQNSRTGLYRTPHVQGDFFDGGARIVTFNTPVSTGFFAKGAFLLGDSFALGPDGPGFPNSVFTDGAPQIAPNTYGIIEPLPPNDVPTSPGPGFTFDGGTAVFTESPTSTDPSNNDPRDPGSGDDWFVSYSFSQSATQATPAGGGGVSVRRFKIAENNSPFPRDRFFFNYSFFNDVQTGFGDVSRYSVGFEKTTANERMSMEVRLPFAGTLDNEQTIDSVGVRAFEFGDLLVVGKILLYANDRFVLTTGSGFAIPTAAGTELKFSSGQSILYIPNESVHYLPYIAWALLPNPDSRLFYEQFIQFDFDGNGDRVYADPAATAISALPKIGTFTDSSILFVDATIGYWLIDNPSANRLTGLAPVAELHYASTLNDTDVVEGNGVLISDISRRLDVLNLTLGTHMVFRRGLDLASGISLPLRSGDDDPFDFECLVQANWRF